jgi:hypothetical protein
MLFEMISPWHLDTVGDAIREYLDAAAELNNDAQGTA